MSLMTKLLVGCVALGTFATGTFPVLALPATLTTGSNLRRHASEGANIITTVPQGTQVKVLNTTSNYPDYWYYIEFQRAGKLINGWVRSDLISVRLGNNTYANIKGVNESSVNVRSQPNTNSRIIRTATVGDIITIEGSSRGSGNNLWYFVKFPHGATGWVRGDFVSVWPKGCVISCPYN